MKRPQSARLFGEEAKRQYLPTRDRYFITRCSAAFFDIRRFERAELSTAGLAAIKVESESTLFFFCLFTPPILPTLKIFWRVSNRFFAYFCQILLDSAGICWILQKMTFIINVSETSASISLVHDFF